MSSESRVVRCAVSPNSRPSAATPTTSPWTARSRADGPLTSRRLEQALNLGFMLTTCEAILRSALERTESRGAHFRSD